NHYGRLYDCGANRNGDGYKEVTASTDPEVAVVKKQFETLLEKFPAPILPEEGRPKQKKAGRGSS
ncbi:MAG: hypothetical protein NTZ09_21610, partial [Candidatus Hydrogenedentes bacterium]|nr:hypothetical protein [Candidatus Hydrogenedentota bacterium]